MKNLLRLSLANLALLIASCSAIGQPSYQRNSFTTNVQGNPVVGNALVITNAAEDKHWRFYGADATTIARQAEVDAAQSAAIAYTDGRFIEPIFFGQNITITNDNQTSLRFAPKLNSQSNIEFWQGVGGPYYRIVCVADADRLRFYEGSKIPLEISGTVKLATNLVFSGGGTARTVDYTANTSIYDDLFFPIADLNPPGGESAGTLSATSGQSGDQLAYVMTANNVFFVAPQMQHTWVPGTTIYPHIHMQPQTTAALTNRWKIAISVADIEGTFPASTLVTNDVTVTAGGEQWKHKMINVPTGGISMAGKTGPSTMLRLKYTLLATSGDVHAVAFDVHYRVGGSPVVYTP